MSNCITPDRGQAIRFCPSGEAHGPRFPEIPVEPSEAPAINALAIALGHHRRYAPARLVRLAEVLFGLTAPLREWWDTDYLNMRTVAMMIVHHHAPDWVATNKTGKWAWSFEGQRPLKTATASQLVGLVATVSDIPDDPHPEKATFWPLFALSGLGGRGESRSIWRTALCSQFCEVARRERPYAAVAWLEEQVHEKV